MSSDVVSYTRVTRSEKKELVYTLSFPGKNKAGDLPDMIKLARQWLQDLMDLIGCLEEKGFPLIQLLNKPTEVGYSLIRLLEKLIAG
jgi:outer membrane lipopolysaccharide assembly protein LptE/RlpB